MHSWERADQLEECRDGVAEGIDCYIPRRELEGIGSGRYQAEITLKAADGRIPEKIKASVFIVV